MICCLVLYLHGSDKTGIRPTWPLQSFWGCIMPVRPKIFNCIGHKIKHHCWNQFPVFFKQNICWSASLWIVPSISSPFAYFLLLYVSNATKCTWLCEDSKVFCWCVFSIFSSIELFVYLTDGRSHILLGRVPLTIDPRVVVLMVWHWIKISLTALDEMVFKYMRNEELIITHCINICLPPKNKLCFKPSLWRIGLMADVTDVGSGRHRFGAGSPTGSIRLLTRVLQLL